MYQAYFDRTLEKLKQMNERYAPYIFRKVGMLEEQEYLCTKEHLRKPPEEGWTPFEGALNWGGEWNNLWIRGIARVPEEARGRKLFLFHKTGAEEGLLFLEGEPHGIYNSKNYFIGGNHAAQRITGDAVPGSVYHVAVECYAGHYCPGTEPFVNYGVDCENHGIPFSHVYEGMELCIMEEDIKDFIFDLKAVMQMAKELSDENMIKGRVKTVIERIFAVITQDPASVSDQERLRQVRECRKIMAPLFTKKSNDDPTQPHVGVVGHSHMDTAWLWPISETIRKCARTYSSALSLMEQYPEYRFIQSSSLHLDWMRRYYPSIFQQIQKRVAEGRYEPNGGVWVECDCNITSGEFMIRQFLKGQLYTRKYFGYTSDCFWLPDTFGYNAAIPQIMRGCETKYFYTTKISWGDLNPVERDTFIWRGIDGSEVYTHYNLTQTFPDVLNTLGAARGIKDPQAFDGRLLAFGYGDGGGGPSYGMIEDARRTQKALGTPNQYYTSISDFMKEVEAHHDSLHVYDGELYLEYHRGTLTQMHQIKRNNRKTEFSLRGMEYFNVVTGAPRNENTDELFETALKNQFHDILPGTALRKVHELACKEMEEVQSKSAQITKEYQQSLTDGDDYFITFFNTLSFGRKDEAVIENADFEVQGMANQHVTDICGRKLLIVGGVDLGGFDAQSYPVAAQNAKQESPFHYDGTHLDTPYLQAEFDEDGFITSLIHKETGRQVRRQGAEPLGCFYMGEDIPLAYDNWDIDSDQYLKMHRVGKLLSSEVAADGPVQFRLRNTYQLTEKTSLVQDVIFHADSAQVDYHTLIDWNEVHQLLKVGFDVDILSRTVKNEIQFGHIDRPTTRNNSVETAKFEVCNHKWSDLSESRFGVALLNDCKYGISVLGSDMQLSLHRAGIRPDYTGDRGVHEMTYSLLPHSGAFCAENVVQPAYVLNVPIETHRGKLKTPFAAPVTVDCPNLICEAVKPAELEENAYVVRIYECECTKTHAKIGIPQSVAHVYKTNMLEDIQEEIPVKDGCIALEFSPFQIITLMMKRKSN